MMKKYYTYMVTNKSRTVLYTGITNSLSRRISEHTAAKGDDSTFAGKWSCHLLIYVEVHESPGTAIRREKQIKGMKRKRKENLILQMNPRAEFLNPEDF